MENKGAIGKITQVISAVLDIKFPEGHLPEINDAIRIPLKKEGGRSRTPWICGRPRLRYL